MDVILPTRRGHCHLTYPALHQIIHAGSMAMGTPGHQLPTMNLNRVALVLITCVSQVRHAEDASMTCALRLTVHLGLWDPSGFRVEGGGLNAHDHLQAS